MVLVQGVVTGRKKGKANDKGNTYHTLQVECGKKNYYVLYEESLLPNVAKDQEISLLCNVNARNNYLNMFAVSHVADEMIVPMDQIATADSFNDF